MKRYRKAVLGAGLAATLLGSITYVIAQEFQTFQGSNQRVGHLLPDPIADNPGRTNLRWWDPLISANVEVDNWEGTGNPAADWVAPPDVQQAFNTFRNARTPDTAPDYVYSRVVASRSLEEPNQPVQGRTANTFSWSIATNRGVEWVLFVNLPIGPTDIDPGNGTTLAFPTRFYVYEVSGVENPDNPGEPVVTILDNLATGGGLARLGGDRIWTSDATGRITVRLINTVVRDSQNNLTESQQEIDNGTKIVYADALVAVRSFQQPGSIASTPLVHQLKVNPGRYDWRTISVRNEEISIQTGDQVRNYLQGIVTSYTADGENLNVAEDGTQRRNLVWSWPSRRPFVGDPQGFLADSAEFTRYALDKRNWITGQRPEIGPSRVLHTIDKDNLSTDVTGEDTGWLATPGTSGSNRGVDYLTVAAGSASHFTVRPKLLGDVYEVFVWIPNNVPNLANRVRYEIYEGGEPGVSQPTAVVTLDQRAATPGWVRLRTDAPFPRTLFRNSPTATLKVRLNAQGSQGGTVYADAIRFVAQSDLRVTSTPVATTARVRVGANLEDRDVVLVALENGRIYCLDAQGNRDGNGNPDGTTNVYWVYPSERPTGGDPNHVIGLDGPDGIAENPNGFDLSSAIVQRVTTENGPEDLLYIYGRNGRVYCIEMAGRGDGTAGAYGTTTRRWTYPNDYPAVPDDSALQTSQFDGAGSIAFEQTSSGPTLYVPTSQGRLYALDAVGNGTTRTTTTRWTFPALNQAPLGPITMTPLVRFGSVYFGAGTIFYALNFDTGVEQWRFTGGGDPMQPYRNAGPASAEAAYFNNNQVSDRVDAIYVPNDNRTIYALNARTGAQLWKTDEITSTAANSLVFTRISAFNGQGTTRVLQPVVVVPTVAGRYVALFAAPSLQNNQGGRRAWQYNAEGTGLSSLAVGGPRDNGWVWMYGTDRLGYLYAFNDSDRRISVGEPPGTQEIVENDPSFEALQEYAQQAKVRFVGPADYEQLVEEYRNGTLTYADITNLTGGANERVTRRNFEYGETLYVVVFDIPNPRRLNDPLNTLTVSMQFTTPGAASQRRTATILPVNGAPADRDGVAFVAFPLLGIGGNALSPGAGSIESSLVVQGSQGASARIEARTFNLANPMGVEVFWNNVTREGIGVTLDARNNEVILNGNDVPGEGTRVVRSSLGPDVRAAGDPVSHGQTSVNTINLYDRTLMRLLLGEQRGLSNVRLNTSDLGWQGQAAAAYKSLDSLRYPNYEDLPTQLPNISIDYPDLRRDALRFTKELFGAVENPLFSPISLNPPQVAQADLDRYRTTDGFNEQLVRRLVPTVLNGFCDVPKFQPPNRLGQTGILRGYAGLQYAYIDSNQNGRLSTGSEAPEAFRQFHIAADVAIDERIDVGTPTVDLGSLPGGTGYSPLAPTDAASPFNPWNTTNPLSFANLFQRFRVFNNGNVNLLNVRLAKGIDRRQGIADVFQPLRLRSTVNHQLAYIEAGVQLPNRTVAPLHLHSDIDPRFAPVGGTAILQKPRPGDLEGTTLSPNPKRRANGNLDVAEGYPLANPDTFPPGDPRVAVSVPIGTPVGAYITRMYVVEDRNGNLALSPDDPSLNGLPGLFNPEVFEPFADPGFNVRFTVRETRLTTTNTPRAAPMVDELNVFKPSPPFPPNTPLDFYWSNQQPAVMRDGSGNIVLAFASNRRNSNNAPGWLGRNREEADNAVDDQWRIYVSTLKGSGPVPPDQGLGVGPLTDLNAFVPDTATRWFRQQTGPYPTFPDNLLFGINSGEQLDPSTINYGAPTWPSSGPFNPLEPINAGGRQARDRVYLAFMGEAIKRTARGERVPEQRLFIAPVTLRPNARVSVSRPVSMRFDVSARKSRPSMVQAGDAATIFYSLESAGLSQIAYNFFVPGNREPNAVQGFSPTQTLTLNNAFESLGVPSATLRRRPGQQNQALIDLTFTAKLRGRQTSEAFITRLRADATTGRPANREPQLPFPTRLDNLSQAQATGVYWLTGVDWRLNSGTPNLTNDVVGVDIVDEAQRSLLNSRAFRAGDEYIDIFRFVGNRLETILDHRTLKLDRNTGILSYESVLGGRVFIDTGNGSVRFAGTIIPRDLRLIVRYTPAVLRVSQAAQANYRGITHALDERFIGDISYWANENNQAIQPQDPVRNDRFVVTYTRTSIDGQQPARPYMRTLRFGIQLPTALQTDQNGRVVLIQVNGNPTVPFYQIDPGSGRLYFMAESEDAVVNVTYRGVDEAGRPYPGPISFTGRVGMIGETDESIVPIEQVANESSLAMALDPMNEAFNSTTLRRPGLIWFVWTSTRSGSPDLFFQTIGPRFSPRPPDE